MIEFKSLPSISQATINAGKNVNFYYFGILDSACGGQLGWKLSALCLLWHHCSNFFINYKLTYNFLYLNKNYHRMRRGWAEWKYMFHFNHCLASLSCVIWRRLFFIVDIINWLSSLKYKLAWHTWECNKVSRYHLLVHHFLFYSFELVGLQCSGFVW